MKIYKCYRNTFKKNFYFLWKIAIVNNIIHDPEKRQKISQGIINWCNQNLLVKNKHHTNILYCTLSKSRLERYL